MAQELRLGAVIESLVSVPMVFYGFAFLKAWISLEPILAASVAEALPVGAASLLSALFVALLAFFFVLAKVRFARKVTLIAGLASQLIATLCLLALMVEPSLGAPVLYISFGFQNFGMIAIALLWVDAYAALNPVRMAFLNAASILLGAVVIYLVEPAPLERFFPIMIALPLLSALCLSLALRTKIVKDRDDALEATTHSLSIRTRLVFPYKVIAFIAAYSLANGLISATASSVRDPSLVYISVIPAVIIMVFILLNVRNFNASVLYRLAFPLMVGGFLLLSIIPGLTEPLPEILMNAGFSTMEMLLLFLVCLIAYSHNTSALWLFCVLGFSQFFFRGVGVYLGEWFAATPYFVVIQVLALVLVILASVMIMSERNLFVFWEAHYQGIPLEEDSESDEGESEEDFLKARINLLAITHRLTEREKEVLTLLVQKKTYAEIAHETFTSEGTIRSHMHHIYQKMGVHTRKEVIALIEQKSEE